jgi:hypothetical protein
MRGVLFALAAMWLLVSAPRANALTLTAAAAPTISAQSTAIALQVPDKKIEVTVGDRSGGGVWYRSPVWIAIGVLAFVVLVMLIVLLSRSGGGGTTIVRE